MSTRADNIDPLTLAQALIRCRSVTPLDDGALDILQTQLESLGFVVKRYPFGDVDNLYARLGTGVPNFCFAGHTDVVPTGNPDDWQDDPFAAKVRDGVLWGRGAADMKGAIAAFIAAAQRHLSRNDLYGSISLLITGDEEGEGINGTKRVLKTLAEEGETISHCLVGEPSNPKALGDEIKNGRRGSLNGIITIKGQQGHVAYPERAQNPIPPLITVINRLYARLLDDGVPGFQPSNLEVTSIDVDNPAHNIIPAAASARFNIRFNVAHTGAQLCDWIEEEARAAERVHACAVLLDLNIMGEAFLTPPGTFTTVLQNAVQDVTGRRPALTTGGGTSDARFIKDYAPVAEFGLTGASMHKANEHVPVSDIHQLSEIYERVLALYFKEYEVAKRPVVHG
ncbi:MAG: succinyl-diaminopimelate desuccinylase [Robiginitomaculum sp.]|nr:MAG: succinyl-diaminopimelate desuccinylase [Robiginitomaculum sp.]